MTRSGFRVGHTYHKLFCQMKLQEANHFQLLSMALDISASVPKQVETLGVLKGRNACETSVECGCSTCWFHPNNTRKLNEDSANKHSLTHTSSKGPTAAGGNQWTGPAIRLEGAASGGPHAVWRTSYF